MKTIWDYPVRYGYGNVPGYDGFHTGEDRPAPTGTPITVNGVTIGLVGTTGNSTGPHLHTGRWINGASTDPAGGGSIVANGRVIQVDEDSRSGKYVRVQDADGSYWVYCHMSKQLVSVGQELKGEDDMYNGKTAKEWCDLYMANGQPNDGDIINYKKWSTGDPNFQPEGKDFDFYKELIPGRGWKRLAEDTRVQVEGSSGPSDFDVIPDFTYKGQATYKKKG